MFSWFPHRVVLMVLMSGLLVGCLPGCGPEIGEDAPRLELETFPGDPDNLNCPGVNETAIEGYARVEVTKLSDGRCYPSDQFHTPSNPDRCPETHFHYNIFSLNGHERQNSEPCGSVVESEIQDVGVVFVPSRKVREWNDTYEKYRIRYYDEKKSGPAGPPQIGLPE